LFDDAYYVNEQEKALVASLTQEQRADNRRKLQENQQFIQEWEAEGRTNWKDN